MTDPQFKRGDRIYVRNSDNEPWLSATLIYEGSWLGLPTYLALVDGMPRNNEFNQIKKQ
jgi:hypothetical protein